MNISYFKVLKKRNFSLLWIGQIISQFGDRLTQMALIGLVYKVQPGSSMGLAKVMSLAIVPVFLFSPVAGVYVDRWNKRKTMYVSDVLRGIFTLAIPFVYFTRYSLLFIYILIFLSFCVGKFFIPAKMAIIPSIVNKDELFLANSLVSITAMIAAVLGLGMGGIIVEKWGARTVFVLDAITFLVSSLLVLFMKVEEKGLFNPKDLINVSKDALLKMRNSVLVQAKEGLSYIFQSPETRYAAKIKMILFAVIGSLYTVFIVFIQKTLSTITLELGLVAIGAGGGLFLGTILYGKFGSTLPVKKTINISLMMASLHLLIFTTVLKLHPSELYAFFSCFILGLLVSPVEIGITTFIHKKSENGFLGRIFSSMEVFLHLAFIVFMFIASYLAEIMTPFTIIASVSITLLLFSLWSYIKES